MEPFDNYPNGGRESLGKRTGSNCRGENGYGLRLQQVTGQTRCAYCGINLVDCYEHWLLMAVDHVVPTGAGREKGIEDAWLADWANLVLSCSGCNGLRNRSNKFLKFLKGKPKPNLWQDFVQLRDECFQERYKEIKQARQEDRDSFNKKPWTEKRTSFQQRGGLVPKVVRGTRAQHVLGLSAKGHHETLSGR